MKILFRQKLFLALFSILSLTLLLSPAQAATKAKSKAAQKERLVLLPMDISAESRAMYGQQESAVVEGLAQKYEVFSGERVMQELRKAASKESSRAKGNCDETRCLEDVAIALQTENVAMVHVTKTEGGYLLSISIKNVMTNQAVFDKSLPCEGCSVFKVIDKLKELGGALTPVALAPAAEAPQPKVNQNDPDAVLWAEAQKGNSADDYQVYIDTYPKGKYLPFAKARIKKLKDEAQALAEQQEQQAWDSAQQSSSEDSYTQYLKGYPQGRFAGLAKVRLDKLKNDVVVREKSRQIPEQAGKGFFISNNANQGNKESLVLMPLRIAEADKNLQEAMETALVHGLEQKYIVFSGLPVVEKAQAVFSRLARENNGKDATENAIEIRALQGIAESFQSELIAEAKIAAQNGGYFIALNIKNIFDNKIVFSKSLPCRGCDSFDVVKMLEAFGNQ